MLISPLLVMFQAFDLVLGMLCPNSLYKPVFFSLSFTQARNKVGQVGYVPEKYLQFPTSNSLLSMLQSLAALDSRSHTSSNSTEAELVSGSLNGDASGKD